MSGKTFCFILCACASLALAVYGLGGLVVFVIYALISFVGLAVFVSLLVLICIFDDDFRFFFFDACVPKKKGHLPEIPSKAFALKGVTAILYDHYAEACERSITADIQRDELVGKAYIAYIRKSVSKFGAA